MYPTPLIAAPLAATLCAILSQQQPSWRHWSSARLSCCPSLTDSTQRRPPSSLSSPSPQPHTSRQEARGSDAAAAAAGPIHQTKGVLCTVTLIAHQRRHPFVCHTTDTHHGKAALIRDHLHESALLCVLLQQLSIALHRKDRLPPLICIPVRSLSRSCSRRSAAEQASTGTSQATTRRLKPRQEEDEREQDQR